MTLADATRHTMETLTPINKELVHKTNVENVFISDIENVSENVFHVSTFFPTDHCVYNDQVSGFNASTYLIEQARQANMAICHKFFNVKLGMNFIVFNIHWQFADEGPFVPNTLEPYTMKVEFLKYNEKDGYIIVKSRSACYQDGKRFVKGGATFLITEANKDKNADAADINLWQVTEPATDTENIQVFNDVNVLITDPILSESGKYRSSMLIDLNHPFYFEHGNSHVPGIMLLEAGKQMALCSLKKELGFSDEYYGDIINGEILFNNFATFDTELFLEVETGEKRSHGSCTLMPVNVSFVQNDSVIGTISGTGAFADSDTVKETSAFLCYA